MKKLAILLFSTLFLILYSGCEETMKAPEVEETLKLTWLGFFAEEPEDPGIYCVYYDLGMRCTRIFTGYEWQTMAIGGIDAPGITWLGEHSTYPPEALPNSTFYHTEDRVSYILTADGWDTLNISGKDALSIQHIGIHTTAPLIAEINDIYYNSVDEATYIYTINGWEVYNLDGLDGIAMNWLGEFEVAPEPTLTNASYYNTTLKKSFIHDGTSWQVLSIDGEQGITGKTIIWLGELDSFPVEPVLTHSAFFHNISSNSYIFDGVDWTIFSTAGEDGIGILWLGDLADEPSVTAINSAYRNIKDGNSYIYDGSKWNIMSVGGSAGENGLHGYSVIWKGSLTMAPDSAVENWAYYSVYEGCSYIYRDEKWETLIPSPIDGITLNWLGEFSSAPLNPKENDAYFDTEKKASFYYQPGSYQGWQTLCGATGDGSDGMPVVWKGHHPYAPYPAESHWVYYNTTNENTYQYMKNYYNNYSWVMIAEAKNNGTNGSSNFKQLNQILSNNDTIMYSPQLTSNDVFFNAQYYWADSTIQDFSVPDPAWKRGYKDVHKNSFKSEGTYCYNSVLTSLTGDRFYSLALDTVTGTLYGSIYEHDGTASVAEYFVASGVKGDHNVIECADGTLLLTFLAEDSTFVVQRASSEGVIDTAWYVSTKVTKAQSIKRANGNISFLYVNSNDSLFLTSISAAGLKTDNMFLDDSVYTFTGFERKSGTLLLNTNNYYDNHIISLDSEDNSTIKNGAWNEEILKIVESDEGRLFALKPYSYGYNGYQKSTILAELNDDFEILNQKMFDNYNRYSDIVMTEDNSIALCFSIEPEYNSDDSLITPGRSVFSVLNQDMELESSTTIHDDRAGFALVITDNKILSVASPRAYDDVVVITDFERERLQPKLEIRQMSSTTACIINNSGRDIKISVSGYSIH